MNVIVVGGTGLIGRALTRGLLSRGHRVTVLTRRVTPGSPMPALKFLQWDGRTSHGWVQAVDEADEVVNLVGKSLNSWPWTAAKKDQFRSSRVVPGSAIVAALARAEKRPRAVLQVSGVGYYGSQEDPVDESASPGEDQIARLVVDWERSTQAVEECGARQIVTRLGIVLTRAGGILPIMALPFRLYAGGPLGAGRQWVSWIHVEDLVSAMLFLLENPDAQGVYNLSAPGPVTNAQFGRSLARALNRPYWFQTPAWALRLVLGEMSMMVLKGQPVLPARLTKAGFQFRYPDIDSALEQIYSQPGSRYLLLEG